MAITRPIAPQGEGGIGRDDIVIDLLVGRVWGEARASVAAVQISGHHAPRDVGTVDAIAVPRSADAGGVANGRGGAGAVQTAHPLVIVVRDGVAATVV